MGMVQGLDVDSASIMGTWAEAEARETKDVLVDGTGGRERGEKLLYATFVSPDTTRDQRNRPRV